MIVCVSTERQMKFVAKSQLKTGAIMSYLNMALGTLIPMFYTPLMLEFLGQNEYGLYKLSGTVISYLSLISFGIGSAVVRYLVKFKTEGDKDGLQKIFGLFNVIFTIVSLIALIAGAVLVVCVPFIYSNSLSSDELLKMQIMIGLLTVNTAVSFTTTAYNGVVTCFEKFIFLQLVNIIATVLVPVSNIIVLLMGYKSIGMTVVTLSLGIVTRIVYSVYVRCSIKVKPVYKNMPTHLIKELLIFSFWIFVSNIVNQLYASTDTMIIGAIPALATVGVAVYHVGAIFNHMMLSFTQGITSVLTPKINTAVFSGDNGEELTDLVIRFGRLQAYIVAIVCSGFIVFGQDFILLWAGKGYEEAYWVALLTMVPSCVPLMQSVALNIIVAQNKHRFRALVYLAIAIINVGGTLVAVNYWGIVGAAAVSCVAYIIGQLFVMNWYYWKKIKLNIPRFWKSVANIFVAPVILGVSFSVANIYIDFNSWIRLFAGIGTFAVLFVLISWFFAMNDYEKDIFRGPVKKIFRKLFGKVKR